MNMINILSLNYKECFFFFLRGRGLSFCFPLSLSVTTNKVQIEQMENFLRPLAKSRDFRNGSIVRIEDLYSGAFSRGFLSHKIVMMIRSVINSITRVESLSKGLGDV